MLVDRSSFAPFWTFASNRSFKARSSPKINRSSKARFASAGARHEAGRAWLTRSSPRLISAFD